MTKARILVIRISMLVSLLVTVHLKGIGQDIQVKGISFYEGLNTNVVSMSQDKYGFIWIATFSKGLFKYDGSTFVNYISDPQDSTTLPGNSIECVLADDNGNIWVGSQFGLSKLDPITNKFQNYKHDPNDPESLNPYRIITLAKGKDGNIWIGTQKGLSRINTLTGKIKHKHTEDPDEAYLQQEHIRSLYTDKTGTLWIGCGSPFYHDRNAVGGLFKLDNDGNITRYINSDDSNSITNNNVKSIYEDSRGVLWIGTAGDGLHTLNRQTHKFTHYSIDSEAAGKLSRPALGNEISYVDDHISFITEDDLGWIWIGTMENGINRYDPESGTLQHFGTQEEAPFKISSNKLFNAFKSADHKLWIMTWDPTKQDQSILKVNTKSNKIPYKGKGSRASSFAEDKNGNIYIGYRDGFFEIMDLQGSERRVYLPNLKKIKGAVLNSLLIDDQGTLWITVSEQGFYKYSIPTNHFEQFLHNPKDSASISTDFLQKVIEYGDDTLLIASDQGLEFFSRRDKIFFSASQNLLSTGVSEILRGSDNTVWIGFEGGGVSWSKGNDQNYNNDRGGEVFNIFQDSKNQIWATNRFIGLVAYNKKSKEFYAQKFSQPLLVRDVGEDPDRNLWLKTQRGYGRFNPDNEELILLESDWGINSDLSGNDIFVSSKGDIFNGYDRGYNHFTYNKILADSNDISQPYLSGILIDDEAANFNINLFELDQIKLSHLQKNLTLEFGSIDFSASEENKLIKYKLIPYENAWRSTTPDQKVSYYNLSPGDYTLKLTSANVYGHWTIKEIKIIINPPWYNTWWAYLVYTLLIISLVGMYIRFRGRQLQAENDRLEFQVKERTNALNQSLENLKATQSQLIQSEKMASLGELTAGIAHEIQNPLNFVNNFSEVSSELVHELKEELDKGDINEAKAISDDVIQNLEKINHHGNRASSIVKGMLEHSRTSSGQKEPTDINALCDEYLRLSYHGLRAKDKSFNAKFETDFDESLPKLNVVPQDIGRVVLNLINNAFYVVDKKAKESLNGYKPEVTVTTKLSPSGGGKREEMVEITVSDNGPGVPEEIKDKIFQPFFTTKPTGQGTGLGLSLSYDIVKAHGGELKVEAKEGDGSKFLIYLPFLNNQI